MKIREPYMYHTASMFRYRYRFLISLLLCWERLTDRSKALVSKPLSWDARNRIPPQIHDCCDWSYSVRDSRPQGECVERRLEFGSCWVWPNWASIACSRSWPSYCQRPNLPRIHTNHIIHYGVHKQKISVGWNKFTIWKKESAEMLRNEERIFLMLPIRSVAIEFLW